MTLKTIKTGAQPNDGTGDNLRTGAQIINENFAELDQRAVLASTEIGKLDALTKALADKTGPGLDPAVRAILTRWGLGDSVTTLEERLLSWITVSAFVFVFPQNGQNSLPTRETGYYVVHLQNADPKYAAQLAFNGSIGVMFRRVKAGDAWTPWTRLIQQGDFGVGSKDDAAYVGNNLNPNDYLTGGDVVGQFNMDGTLRTGALIVQAGSNATACAQQFVDWASGRMYSRGKSGSAWTKWRFTVSVGDFGLGARALEGPGAPDMDAPIGAGIYGWTKSYKGAPSTISNGEYIHLPGNDDYASQIAASHDSDNLWYRRKTASWQTWKRFMMEGTRLPRNSNVDLNNLTSRTEIWCDSNCLNLPLPGDWIVEVFSLDAGIGDYVLQRATFAVGSTLPVFHRRRVAGVWGAWFQGEDSSVVMNDMNAVVSSGKYRITASTLNTPFPNMWGTVDVSMYDATNWTQLLVSTSDGTVYSRNLINGSIGQWHACIKQGDYGVTGSIQRVSGADANNLPKSSGKFWIDGSGVNQPTAGADYFIDQTYISDMWITQLAIGLQAKGIWSRVKNDPAGWSPWTQVGGSKVWVSDWRKFAANGQSSFVHNLGAISTTITWEIRLTVVTAGYPAGTVLRHEFNVNPAYPTGLTTYDLGANQFAAKMTNGANLGCVVDRNTGASTWLPWANCEVRAIVTAA
ncbi:MAG: hypothetical protein ACQZ2J_15650 [Pseudomonas piscis]|uniref:pyocin knob domain-containing protein n=1 Tax=Pseudomonas piscis TaxID=2614538 RepID=UPI003D27DEDF